MAKLSKVNYAPNISSNIEVVRGFKLEYICLGKHTVYRMSASTEEEKDEWIKCIQQSISHNPFYDMLAARKKKAQKNSP